ncbi:hypothetical protein [Brachyspira pilosicoli]|uniref:hypothetical protein n=1 Tax=Brachyspira pilosicoli TaxID=52584 RepID=UPI003007B630
MLTFGSLSEEGRSNGIQGDAIRNIVASVTGNFGWDAQQFAKFPAPYNPQGTCLSWGAAGSGYVLRDLAFNLEYMNYPIANEIRTKNRLIRIYRRIA